MAAGGELIIDNKLLKLLDSVDKKLEKVAKSSGRAQDHISKMFNKVNVQNVDGIIQKLRLLEKNYSTIGQNDSRGMKRIANDARKTADEINKLIAAVQQRWTPNFKGAMNYSQNAQTLNQDREAINRLRQARETLSRTDSDYFKKLSQINGAIAVHSSRLRAATGASHEMSTAHRGLMDISGQLTRKLALVFSVSQVQGYINKIVQVRREFELQQKALGAILRDQDKGNELWNQTIQLAVKSPFRVKELITYTKQLAAYRIETEKLHDTTRMLADVSAGLGVDMNRLILAYGQVRAAEYLRGTELRQFTEAGIPLLAELAEHFSALEGRAVSTADVFEMISKRMVTFADVSQVFQKMTSEGGVFFQMQEKQSETLHGLINNLYDSVDLMMNAIGKENEGTIVGFLKSVKSLAESWREVAVRIKDVGTALLIAKSAQWVFTTSFNRGMAMNKMSLLGLNLGIKESTISFNKWIATLSIAELKTLGFSTKTALLQKAFAGIKVAAMGAANAIASFLPVAIIYGLYELYMALTKASREAERLRKELSDTVSVDVADLDKAIARYENLANRLGMVNKGSMAHKEIISALNKEYGEYLDFLVNEETTVAQLNAAYDNLVETMRQKQSMEAFQKGMDTIAEHYRTQITEANKTFKDEFGKIGQLELKTTDNNQYLIPTSEEVEHIFNLINQKVRETKDVTSIDDLTEQRDLLNSVIEEFYGKDITLLGADYDNLKFIELMVNRRKEELQLQKEIDAQFKKSLKTREANLALTALQNKYEEDKLKIVNKTTSEFEKQEELSKLKDKFELDVIDLKLRFNIIGDQEASEEKDKIINWAKGTIGDINETIKSELGSTFSGEELSKVLFTRELKETKTIANYLKDLKTSWESQNKVIAEQISLKSELGELDENNEKILQDALRKEELYRRTLKLLGVEIQYTERLSEGTRIAINSLEGLPEEMQISLEQAYGGIDNILSGLKKKETEHLNVIRQLNELKANGLPYDEQRLKMAEQTYWWTKKLQDLIDPDSKTAIAEDKVDYINSKLEEKYQIDSIGRTKDEVTLLSEANTEKEAAIAYEKQLNAQKAMGLAITQEQLNNAKKETEQTTLKWKLLGGTKEEGGGGRANSLYDERLKVIDDMNKKYKELNRTLDKTNSLQGAFDAYKDAFAEAFAGIKWIPKNVQSMTPQEFASQVLNFPNENDLVKFLDRLAEEPMKTFEKIKVELAKGKYVYDMKVRAKVEDDETLIRQVEEMFGTYELSLELKDMNIPTDIAEKLFGFESLDLEGLKEKLKKLEPQFIGTGQEKKYRDFLEKVDEMEAKALEDRMKKYAKFLEQEQTERVKIKLNEVRQLMEIEDTFRIHEKDAREKFGMDNNQWKAYEKQRKAGKEINLEFLIGLDIEEKKAHAILEQNRLLLEQSQIARRGVERVTQEDLDKNAWEEFKESSYYETLFADMEHSGTKSLRNLRDKIVSMKDTLKTLPPEIYKQVVESIEKIENELDNRNPLGALFGAWKELRNLSKKGVNIKTTYGEDINVKSRDKIAERLKLENESLEKNREEIALRKQFLHANEQIKRQLLEANSTLRDDLDNHRNIDDAISEKITKLEKEGKIYEANIKQLSTQEGRYRMIEARARNAQKGVQEWANATNDLIGSVDSLLDAFGLAEDSQARIWMKASMGIVDTIASVAQLIIQFTLMEVAANSALGIIGYIAMALKAIATLIATLFGNPDEGLQKQIEALEVSVEALDRKFQKLEKSIKNAMGVDDINRFTDDAIQNLEEQNKALGEMIALEEAKKGTDAEKIRDWANEIEDNLEEVERLRNERIQELGGIGGAEEIKSAAEEFTDAWLQAFLETGDGLVGLEDKFNDFARNLIKSQLMHKVVESLITPLTTKINEIVDPLNEGGGEVTDKEWQELMLLWNEQKVVINERLSSLIEELGGLDSLSSNRDLEGLQKGVQGIQESTAQEIVSYMNSLRALVAQRETFYKNNEQLSSLLDNIVTDGINPMLDQLRVIANNTESIHTLLDSVVRAGHSQGGYGIKVFSD